MSEEERVLGGFEANARLEFGSERFLVFLTQRRLIMAHRAKVGRAGLTLSSLLGKLATGADSIVKGGQDLRKMAELNPEDILSMNSENLAIEYCDVVSLSVQPQDWKVSRIILVGKNRKVEMSASSVALDGVKVLMQELLGEKVSFQII